MLFGKFVGFAGCKITPKNTLGTSFSLKTRSWLSFMALPYVLYILRVRAIPIYRESTDSLISLVSCPQKPEDCQHVGS